MICKIFLFFCGIGVSYLHTDSNLLNSPAVVLDEKLVCDLRLLTNQSFFPLKGFMNQEDYQSVITSGRLANGALFPLPIVLPISFELAMQVKNGGSILLMDQYNHELAVLHVEEIYSPSLDEECLSALGTLDPKHPSVDWILSRRQHNYVSGEIQPLAYLLQMDQREGVLPPKETREFFQMNGWDTVVAFQTRNPLHRAHVAVINQCLEQAGDTAALFLHPTIGPTQDDDVKSSVRMKCYDALRPYLNKRPLHLGYIPLAMRMAGPKEALLHALIRKNYGATHFIIGRDHAGPSVTDSLGNSFYSPYAAQDFVKIYAEELGLKILSAAEMVFVEETQNYVSRDDVLAEHTLKQISGTQVREKMQQGLPLPHWYSFPEVEQILRNYYSQKNGLCIYLTGLPCSGKSTLALQLKNKIESIDPFFREVMILDGDVVRSYIASELGFSKKDRSINVRRIGYIASMIVRNGGICICANIAPYEEDRKANRALIDPNGVYFEIFVNTPIEICEKRDVKGHYKLARSGIIKEFTGVSDPYEIPCNSALIINGEQDIDSCIEEILQKLQEIYLPLSRIGKEDF